MAWFLVATGAVMTLVPGIIDPYAPVNGLTLLGLLTLAAAYYVAVRQQ